MTSENTKNIYDIKKVMTYCCIVSKVPVNCLSYMHVELHFQCHIPINCNKITSFYALNRITEGCESLKRTQFMYDISVYICCTY